jgi:hypothetical protein
MSVCHAKGRLQLRCQADNRVKAGQIAPGLEHYVHKGS